MLDIEDPEESVVTVEFRKTLLRRRLLRLLTPLPLRLLTLSEIVAQADLIPICLPYQ